MPFAPSFHDIAHVGHVELFTPEPEKSLTFFTKLLGLMEAGRQGDSVFLRAWGDYETYTLKLTASTTSGLGHLAFRVRSEQTLQGLAEYMKAHGVEGSWSDGDFGHGRSYTFHSPDGHAFEIYFQTQKFVAPADQATCFKNQPQRRAASGIAPRRLDHVNLLAADVKAMREFVQRMLGLRVTEQIVLDDGLEAGAWLSATNKSYDVAVTRDHSGARGRFHHLTYFMDNREEVLRAADLLVEAGIAIETGPHKHNIGQTFFLYFLEPGGNRMELGFGGYLILDPDWKPVVWSQAERAKGQAWGLQTVQSFHTYGTPPVPET
jgi:catechol 2,3-dioxygenase